MQPYTSQTNFRHDQPPAIGVLLTNVGTPDAPDAPALRRYLGQFLADPRVIEPPPARWLWQLILHGIILRTRPAKSAKLYQNVWTPEGSPLLAIVKKQRTALEIELRKRFEGPLFVEAGMGYGQPSVAEGLRKLREQGCRKILVLPGFPQYSGATTGSTFDAIAHELTGWRWVPELRFNTNYHDHPGYVAALAASVWEYWAANGEPDRLLISFHGLPRRYVLAGDPYHCQCLKTARLLTESLGLPKEKWLLTFQSRFGREPWLQPYTDMTLIEWAKAGVGRVDTLCPAFSADCLETLEEMNMTNREMFMHAGGKDYRYIPALNERPDHINVLADVAAAQMAGWVAAKGSGSAAAGVAEGHACMARYEAAKKTSLNAG